MDVAFVTGGGSGIGEALCRRLAVAGYAVVVADVDGGAAARVVAAIDDTGGDAVALTLDVTDREAVEQAVERATRRGRLALMVNNAGIAIGGEALRIAPADWRRVNAVNYEGVLHGTLAAYRIMKAQGSGQIVNTASATGLVPQPGNAPYCASKHAVVGLSRALRYEAEAFGVGVSVVCPGRVRTGITEHMRVEGAANEQVLGTVRRARWMEPDRAAELIWRGVRANREYIVFPRALRVLWYVDRVAPSLAAPQWRGMIARLRRATNAPVPSAGASRQSRAARSTTVTESVVVRGSVADTWAYLTDFRNMPSWARGVERILSISPGPTGEGTTVTDVGYGIKRRWPETFRVEEYEPERTLGLIWNGAYGTAHVRYTLEARPEGTLLTGHTFGDYRFPFSLLLAFMGRTATENFTAGLENIRDRVEGTCGRERAVGPAESRSGTDERS